MPIGCKDKPFESQSGNRRRSYLLGQARRRKRIVVAVLAFASPFVLFGLGWACLRTRARRLLPAVTMLGISGMDVGDAGAAALACTLRQLGAQTAKSSQDSE